MLKALEIVGFKSFADKTRFDFPPGITVIVGPNGSGKSNVVDAIKWVLGEQSARSLRGKDMADVIFKGSSTAGRKPLNTAEATIIIDNSDGRFGLDAPEVHVTRRVYRSGEGEYLINGQACRLKDVKDLFRGTGVGADAYSLIEQGKVDQLLQASPRDRRAIFEEAAGVSRFKAKKVEALRRLERVDQNLVRLGDIVEEVEGRLKSVRAQAAKAKRYREAATRLQELRTQVGLVDWRKLGEALSELEARLAGFAKSQATTQARCEGLEKQSREKDQLVEELVRHIQTEELRLSKAREQIAAQEAGAESDRARLAELENALAQVRSQLVGLVSRAGQIRQTLIQVASDLSEAREAEQRQGGEVATWEAKLASAAAELLSRRQSSERNRAEYVELMRQSAALGQTLSAAESALEMAQQVEARCNQRIEELNAVEAEEMKELSAALRAEESLATQVSAIVTKLEETRRILGQRRDDAAQLYADYTQLRGKHAAVSERRLVLEELEKNLEGLGAGVKEVLAAARSEAASPYHDVRGLMAELIQVDVDLAPLVDIALGEASQYVVLRGPEVIEKLKAGALLTSGRVGFVYLDALNALEEDGDSLECEPGVVQRMDRLVETTDEDAALAWAYLGQTWLVESLSVALRLKATRKGDFRCVTRAGELVDARGSVVVGPKNSALGLVSRRSELRELRIQITQLGEEMESTQRRIGALESEIGAAELGAKTLSQEVESAQADLGDKRLLSRSLQERRKQTKMTRVAVEQELTRAREQQATSQKSVEQSSTKLNETTKRLVELEALLREDDLAIVDSEQKRGVLSAELTKVQVEMAKSQQRVSALESRRNQAEEDQREREAALRGAEEEIVAISKRTGELSSAILTATSQLALYYVSKEEASGVIDALLARRAELLSQRSRIVDELTGVRKELKYLDEQDRDARLAASEVRNQRDNLAQRMKEDYQLDLAVISLEESSQPLDELATEQRASVEEEIATLRKRISSLGAVNVEALEELDALEQRFTSLSTQHKDLTEAKEALEQVIHRINQDSRRLFQETMEAIRTNFQQLYRRAFGGGKADIILEEGVDILEAGVEIVATPPGKPSFNNSLLSGGEKALTAVALLLAIFQYRPSPFCVLDEVDAPFDEANVGRFIDVLRDFLGWTKFVIVTHSKKTMTAATTLYGVTMQESGVSKRVSVRFEDVSENGQIRAEAVERSATQEEAERQSA
jgi:chromosome segregation protein